MQSLLGALSPRHAIAPGLAGLSPGEREEQRQRAATTLQRNVRTMLKERRKREEQASEAKHAWLSAFPRGVLGMGNAVVTRAGHSVTSALQSLDAKLDDYEDAGDTHIKTLLDGVKRKVVKKVLRKIGKVVREMLKPAYMPTRVQNIADFCFEGTWPEVSKNLEESIMQSSNISSRTEMQREKRLQHWPKAPPFWGARGTPFRNLPPKPFAWLRAKALYALYPADANQFKHLRDPVAITIMLLKLNPYFGINVLVFIIIFAIMDRSDEYQLIQYVLAFKSFQFLSGVSSACYLCLHLWHCLEATTLQHEHTAGQPCLIDAPGQATFFPFMMLLEVVRVLLLLTSGVLLAGGATYGGMEELLALEHVRVEASNGNIKRRERLSKGKPWRQSAEERGGRGVMIGGRRMDDNKRYEPLAEPDEEAAAKNGGGGGGGAAGGEIGGGIGGGGEGGGKSDPEATMRARLQQLQASRDQEIHDGYPPSMEALRRAQLAARVRYGAKRGDGGMVPYFLIYDVVVIFFLLVFLAFKLLWLRSQNSPEWLYWTTCYYVKLTWGLLSFPYLVYVVPVLGDSLHQAKPTAYDHTGVLCPRLTPVLIKQKMLRDEQRLKLEEEEAKLRERMMASSSSSSSASTSTTLDDEVAEFSMRVAAKKVQKAARTSQDRKRVLRRVVSMMTPVGLFVPAHSVEKWFH